MFPEAQLIDTSIICCYVNYPMGMWFTVCVVWYCALLHQESCLAPARCLLYFTTQLYKDYLLTSVAWTIVNTAMHTTSMYTPQEVKEPLPYTHSPTCSSLMKKSIAGVGLRSQSSSEATSFSSRPLPVSPSDSDTLPFNTAAAWVVERTTTIRGSHFYNHMLRLCSVSFLLFPYYAAWCPTCPIIPIIMLAYSVPPCLE